MTIIYRVHRTRGPVRASSLWTKTKKQANEAVLKWKCLGLEHHAFWDPWNLESETLDSFITLLNTQSAQLRTTPEL